MLQSNITKTAVRKHFYKRNNHEAFWIKTWLRAICGTNQAHSPINIDIFDSLGMDVLPLLEYFLKSYSYGDSMNDKQHRNLISS